MSIKDAKKHFQIQPIVTINNTKIFNYLFNIQMIIIKNIYI